jgi:cobalt-zinc-cadmium efflux system membrane fusion protein
MKEINRKNLAIFIAVVFVLASCHQNSDTEPSKNYLLKDDTIILPDSSNIKPKIKIGSATREVYHYQFYSAAKVTAIPNKYAEIAAPFNGRIMKSFVKLGQDVGPGTPLFSINSSDFTDAQKLFLQARQQYLLAEKDYKREQDLLNNGVGVQKELEAAKTNFEVTKSELGKARASIHIFGDDPDKMLFGEPLIVRSPIKGHVITNDLVVGKYLTDNGSPMLTIAELSPIWIVATVKEKDIRFVHEGDIADAEVTSYPGETFRGRVYHIDESVSEETRSIRVLIECPNKEEKLKYGMYANVKFTEAPVNAVFVPTTALLQFNDKNFVLLQIAPNQFKKQFVTTAETVNGKTLITEGLSGNEKIITEGGFYLLDTK